MTANLDLIAQRVIQIKNGVMTNVSVSLKNIVRAKGDYNWDPIACVCEQEALLIIQ